MDMSANQSEMAITQSIASERSSRSRYRRSANTVADALRLIVALTNEDHCLTL